MKLKCNHGRRVLVLSSGISLHREDGSKCNGLMTMGDQLVVRTMVQSKTPESQRVCVLSVEGKQ